MIKFKYSIFKLRYILKKIANAHPNNKKLFNICTYGAMKIELKINFVIASQKKNNFVLYNKI